MIFGKGSWSGWVSPNLTKPGDSNFRLVLVIFQMFDTRERIIHSWRWFPLSIMLLQVFLGSCFYVIKPNQRSIWSFDYFFYVSNNPISMKSPQWGIVCFHHVFAQD